MGTAYTGLPEAQQAYATLLGAFNWSSLGTLSIINNNGISTDALDLITTDAADLLVTG
jgi:hypothetical protein